MKFFLIIFFGVGAFTCVYCNGILSVGDEERCPPPEKIAPCTCFIHRATDKITTRCANFTNALDIKAIFDNNPGWKHEDLFIDDAVMSVIPANMVEQRYFEGLYITNSSFVSLFDRQPIRTQGLYLSLTNVKITRGFEWKTMKNVNLLSIIINNMKMKSIGKEFKDNIRKEVHSVLLENNGLTRIQNQAFADLPNLKNLALRGGNLKKVSRDMFPKPSVVLFFDLSYQKIAQLPEDFFSAMPKLKVFYMKGNQLTTISEKVFNRMEVLFFFEGNPIDCNCNIKWIIGKLNPKLLYGECASPTSLKGTKLSSLKESNFGYCH